MSEYSVISLGNAIVDVLANVEDDFIKRHNLAKGSMLLCDQEAQNKLLADIKPSSIAAGGSAANTASTLALLKIKSGFIGSISNDSWGDLFKQSLTEIGVIPFLATHNQGINSGTSIILITPDSERTMNTNLGSASFITQKDLPKERIRNCTCLYIEGYMFDRKEQKETALEAIKVASSSKALTAFTLSDSYCVKRHRGDFLNLLSKIDVLFSNEDEYQELFLIDRMDDIDFSALNINQPPITVITRSEKSVLIIKNGICIEVKPEACLDIVDLTGAGDQFAAGFLYGLINKYELEECGRLGNKLASKVITKLGPRIDTNDLMDMRS